jgi:hypothetical protein
MKPHVLQAITRIYRIPGSQPVYRVVLHCNHRRTVTRLQIGREQLFIRKIVECPECGQEEKG